MTNIWGAFAGDEHAQAIPTIALLKWLRPDSRLRLIHPGAIKVQFRCVTVPGFTYFPGAQDQAGRVVQLGPMRMRPGKPSDITDAPGVSVPPNASLTAAEHPNIWEAYQRLGEATSDAGPLDAQTQRLVHVALAIAADSEGGTHSHARRAIEEGVTKEALEQVALLAITTLGWPHALRGLSWIRDITRG